MDRTHHVPLRTDVQGTGERRGVALAKRVLSTLVLLPLFVAVVVAGPV